MPCATFARTIASTSSGERRRDLRPCTLMMVQKEHWNGQPRPASKLVVRAGRALDALGRQERQSASPSRSGRSFMKL